MHDPKFEKDVQQKMEELDFSPSEAVWLNVERAINGEKKRRLLPFWLFFLPALLLVGAGALYFSGSHHPVKSVPAADAGQTGASQPDHLSPGTDQPGRSVPVQPGRSVAVQPDGARPGTTRPGILQPDAARPGTTPPVALRPIAAKPGNEVRGSGRYAAGKAAVDHQADRAVDLSGDAVDDLATNAVVDRAANGAVDRMVSLAGRPVINAGNTRHLPGLSVIDRHSSAINASALPSGKAPVASKTRLPEPKRPWEAGFAGGIGISSLNQGLLDKSTITSAAYRNYASAVTGVPQTYVSATQPDLSFWAGILLQKSLRKDFSLSLGLNVHYYSSRIRTGGKVTASSALQTPSLSASSFILGNSFAATAQAYPYYSPGDKQSFTNRYYFMELPGSISWQVSHSHRMPLFWEGGFSLSYLVSSNSLYYDPKSGVFYKDGSVINRTQASVFTGLMVGLPLRGMRVQAGPQIQYGFTNLLNKEGAGGQHLLYGGIKLVFLPGKRAGAQVRGR